MRWRPSVGAIYLDQGIEACAAGRPGGCSKPRLDALPSASELKDPKTRLQEWLQGRGPRCRTTPCSRSAASRTTSDFSVRCDDAGLEISATADGSSRRRAEQEAAQRILSDPALN